MNTRQELTPDHIKRIPYTEFVGLINQWNVPPGSYITINQWRVFGEISASSRILEVACTTGFSGRNLAQTAGCSVDGVDTSSASIDSARENARIYAPELNLNYKVADATDLKVEKKYSHVLFGASLRFFSDPEKALKKFIDYIEPGGIFLSCEFFINKKMPGELVEKAKTVFGINITEVNNKEVLKPYRGFTQIYDDTRTLEPETDEEIDHYCHSIIDRFSQKYKSTPDVQKACYERLRKIKMMSNALRPYQMYSVLVHRYDPSVYPNRYTELF